ncbi:MAG TPA: hypothetical protein DCP69_04215 [Candidatus Omnitrophica bacterium]|nr:hypothetical protein [Candidatus Omnitrophota bacterium]
MTQTIKAIETVYRDHRFRSRLEARWAIALDVMGIRWEYEAEGYALGDGQWYLPDFWLSRLGVYLEVKPSIPTEKEWSLARQLSEGAGKICLIGWDLCGDDGIPCLAQSPLPTSHTEYLFWPCGHCGATGLVRTLSLLSSIEAESAGRQDESAWAFKVMGHWACTCVDIHMTTNSMVVTKAMKAAKSARFEHGEHGSRP